MGVEILYCPTWGGYDTRAASLAAEVSQALSVEAKAIPGARSQFDVVADGEVVFSKQAKGRFPDEGEIVRLLAW